MFVNMAWPDDYAAREDRSHEDQRWSKSRSADGGCCHASVRLMEYPAAWRLDVDAARERQKCRQQTAKAYYEMIRITRDCLEYSSVLERSHQQLLGPILYF